MKFMKLGSRPDTFYTAEAVRAVSFEVSSDLVVQVKTNRYLLHKFPVLSKSLRLQQLCSEAPESSPQRIIQLPDFPGGVEAFELCAKFCYGITITLSAHNIVAARCAAEYLQMSEDSENGSLIQKLETFLHSCVLQGWRDSIVVLQSTKAFPLWSEDLGITSQCIDAIASKVIAYSSGTRSSHHGISTNQRKDASCNGTMSNVWWAEDLAELNIDLYWRTMIAIKSSGGKVRPTLVGEALEFYAYKWLPFLKDEGFGLKRADCGSDSHSPSKHRLVLESVVSLLPAEKGSVSCSFLLRLLKAANVLKAASCSKIELARRAGLQLDEASVSDLLVPAVSEKSSMLYDVDVVMTMLEQFMLQGQSPPTSPTRAKLEIECRRSRSARSKDLEFQESRRSSSSSHGSKLKVAKLVDGYLQEIARDENLSVSKFIAIAEIVPDFSRPIHDDLYKAIDVFLKAHPDLAKCERKRLCRILDCKKLSSEASVLAAQNELLPLRVVVQVLFFEHARAAMADGKISDLPSNIRALLSHSSRPATTLNTNSGLCAEEHRRMSCGRTPRTRRSTLRSKLAEEDAMDRNELNPDGIRTTPCNAKGFCSIPIKSKRIISRFLWMNRTSSEKNQKE